jgi:hypothetical protein
VADGLVLKWLRRAAAFCIVALSAFPLHRLLTPERTGPWGAQAIQLADIGWSVTLWGSLVVLLVAILAAVLTSRSGAASEPSRVDALLTLARNALEAPEASRFALGVAALAGLLALTVTLGVQRLLLTNVDEMTALIHARYLAAGHLAGRLPPGSAEAWLIPNMLVVDSGWVSQYPPGHLFVMAAFVFAGVRWLMGPMLFAAMVGLSASSFERLLAPERRALGRAASLLLTLSPFALLLASGALSHLTAGAAGALALYAALRVQAGRRSWWAVVAGAAMGLMVLTRPWTGLVLGPVLTLGVWWRRGSVSLVLRSLAPWVAGGLPFALVLFAYDSALFGGPLHLGYEVLYGPAHGLGFHADPWSSAYGLREAIGYSASDLMQFGATLLDTPVSITLVAGLYLLLVRRLEPAAGIIAAWALLPVLGNALYWFHQPRMLFETAPAWILLAVLAVSALYERSGRGLRNGAAVAAATTLVIGAIGFAPAHFATQRWSPETLSRITVPQDSAAGAVVFVHASWNERTAALLQASGMRNDSIQAVLRRNDACVLYEYAAARDDGRDADEWPAIDLEQTSSRPATLASVRAPGDAVVLQRKGSVWSAECGRQVLADRFGSVALAPLLWQGDLPGLEAGRPLFVRDYGPERNLALRAHFPSRPALVFAYGPDGGPPRLLGYEAGMRLLWGTQGAAP